MADQKITELTALGATPDDADLLPMVDDVAGTPTTKKVTVANLLAGAGGGGLWNSFSFGFESLGRLVQAVTGAGTVDMNAANGLLLWSGLNATGGSAKVYVGTRGSNMFYRVGEHYFCTIAAEYTDPDGDGEAYFGWGAVTVGIAGHTWTGTHIGFKAVYSGGVATLYATNADGTTETASSFSISGSIGESNAYTHHFTAGTNCKFYNNTVLKATHTTNLPDQSTMALAVTNQFSVSTLGADEDDIRWSFMGFSFGFLMGAGYA